MTSDDAPETRPKILNLQILRFIAALGVLLSHAADLTLGDGSLFWRFPWTAGVDIFFVVSGMIMTILTHRRFGQPGAARHFLTRRIIRIVPIYWLATMAMIAVVLLLPGAVRNSQADPASIATSLLFIPFARAEGQIVPILAQGWTLNYEAFFYAAFALALLHRRGLAMLVAGFIALAMLHIVVPPSLVVLHFWSDPVILEFIAGIGIARLWLSGLRLPRAATLMLAALALTLFALAQPLGLTAIGRVVASGIPAAMLGAAFLFAADPPSPGPLRRAIAAAGDASYALYLSHTFTINALLLAVGGALSGTLAMALAVAAAIAISLLIHRLVERPLLRTLHARLTALTPSNR